MKLINRVISFSILSLVLLNLPSIALETLSISFSSPLSYTLFALLCLLILLNFNEIEKEIVFLIFIGSLYFFFSIFNFNGNLAFLLITFFKFIISVIGIGISIKYVSNNIILILLFVGSLTIILDSLFFRFNDSLSFGYVIKYGRYSGFYLNPNIASIVCLIGYIMSITKNNFWKILALFFSITGFLTLSRTFILSWIIVNIIYMIFNFKFIVRGTIFLLLTFIILINYSEKFNLDTNRFDFLTGLFLGEIDKEVMNDDSRIDQWSKFSKLILKSPIIGNGFNSFSSSKSDINGQGIHNTFLLILGESGFLPFTLMVVLFLILFRKCFKLIRHKLNLMLLMIVLFLQFLTNHNFFTNGILIFLIVYVINGVHADNFKNLTAKTIDISKS